jgi:hypothetical protein
VQVIWQLALLIQLAVYYCLDGYNADFITLHVACNETNWLHYLSSVYSVTIPLHVSGLLVDHHQEVAIYIYIYAIVRVVRLKANSHIPCRTHAFPLPCRAAKSLDCVFSIGFTQCGRV